MADEPSSLRHELPAAADQVAVLRRMLREFAEHVGVLADVTAKAVLAVSEAATNVVTHAYVGAEPGPVRLSAWIDGGALRVVIADDGIGLRPRPDSPGMGVGLPLVGQLTDELTISTGDGGRGTTVAMRFAGAVAAGGAQLTVAPDPGRPAVVAPDAEAAAPPE
jgi:serine/threonine-protein kinase RsbW/stage II sporulation protein AB (anti-sigma F factor)